MPINVQTKAPTGLSIARSGWKYTLSWKIADANYGAGQVLQYRTNTATKGKWTAVNISAQATAKTVTLSASAYKPNTKKELSWVEFRVQGRRSRYTENQKEYEPLTSAWATKRITLSAPRKPALSAELTNLANVCSFEWDVETSSKDSRPLSYVQYQSILVQSAETNGSKLKWKTSSPGWQTGTGNASGSVTITEDTTTLAAGPRARWVRVRSVGPAGSSDWRYAKHVYAAPYAAKISAVEYKTSSTTTTIGATWKAKTDGLHPIDYTELEYLIATPAAGFTCPAGGSWQAISSTKDTGGTDAARGTVTDAVGIDQCLWVRVCTYHDANMSASAPALVRAGMLATPSGLTVTLNDSTFMATVAATNESDVPDAFLAVVYRSKNAASDPVVVGIIPAGSTDPVNVQLPDWSDSTDLQISVKAVQGAYTAKPGETGTDVTAYAVTANMESVALSSGGNIPVAAEGLTVEASETQGEVVLAWEWSWNAATAAEISWSANPNAWESTSEPNTYIVNRINAALWRVSDLEVGVRWYFRIRLLQLIDGEYTYAPYSATVNIDLSSAPQVPVLTLSANVITEGGAVTASWLYTSTDGTPQAQAEICEATFAGDGSVVYGEIIARETSGLSRTFTAAEVGWETGETHYLAVRVVSGSGNASGWSDPAQVSIADPVSCEITSTSLASVTLTDDAGEERVVLSMTAFPLTVTVTGAAEDDTTSVIIERAEDYEMDRPDESVLINYAGETVYIYTQAGAAVITVDQDDLIGILDDGAIYRLIATVNDSLGQSASASVDFEVHWAHQALIPSVTAVPSAADFATFLTPVAPPGAAEGDTCDIYRLSADRPRLIYSGAEFGETYVDPYPAIGPQGGHRVVFRTGAGDYITADNKIAWTDSGASLESDYNIIDFGAGRLLLEHNVELSSSWKKDFKQTAYLGGSVQGDWNPAVTRTGSIDATVATDDPETITTLRRLADYPGICHVRTLDGSSFAADVQVSESRAYSTAGKLAEFSLKITRVDSQALDGLTYAEFIREED